MNRTKKLPDIVKKDPQYEKLLLYMLSIGYSINQTESMYLDYYNSNFYCDTETFVKRCVPVRMKSKGWKKFLFYKVDYSYDERRNY